MILIFDYNYFVKYFFLFTLVNAVVNPRFFRSGGGGKATVKIKH